MSALKLILFVSFLYCAASEEIKVKPGDDVLLQCQSLRDAEIRMLKWIKPDLKSEVHVLYFRDDLFEKYKDESFSDRVELKDPEMKNGDVSVIVKNVTVNDTGTYECYVGYGGGTQLITTITLTVSDSGDNKDGGNKDGGNKDGHVGLGVSLLVVLLFVLVAAIVGFVIYRRRKTPTEQNSNPVPTNESQMYNSLRCLLVNQ